MTKGERLHNPFNLEKSTVPWRGLVRPGSDNVFCEFVDDIAGLRAGFVNLHSQLKEGHNTITKLITKYAPPTENDTAAYISAVSNSAGIDASAVFSISNIKSIGVAIIHQEQGEVVYSDDQINQALVAAGLSL